MDTSVDVLGKAKYFTSLDLKNAYFQQELEESCRHLTTFATSSGLYQFKRTPQGLKTSGSSFQSLINLLMRGYHYQILIAYLNDLLIFSETIDTHIDNLRDVLGSLDEANLRLNLLNF